MTIQDFINQHNNQALDFDGYYGAQCVDLVQYWAQANGWPTFSGNAVDIAGQTHNFYQWIANSPSAVPGAGDIVVWGQYAPHGITSAGHIAVAIGGDTNSFNSFDQNWPEGANCHVVHHDYGGVLGWLHAPTNQGDNVTNLTPEQVNILMQIAQNRPATEDEKAVYPTRDATQVLQSILNSDGSKTFRTEASNFEAEQAALSTANQQINDLKAQLATQSNDTSNLNAFGSALRWLIARLGLK